MRANAFLAIVLLVGCDRSPETAVGTSLLIRVAFEATITPTQLRFTAEDDRDVFFGPKVRPEVAAAGLSSEQSLRLLLPDSRAGQSVKVVVEALSASQILATGSATAAIIRGREVTLTVVLARPGGTDGCASISCASGQRCVGDACVCDVTSCLNGCCAGGICYENNLLACGFRASACVMCDSTKSGTCGPTGFCQCGPNIPCGTGQRCNGGSCVCDATSCPGGCCAGTTCNAMSLSSCGMVGGACTSCNLDRNDSCADGSCGCGSGPACAGGQRCVGGLCVCDATSCASGCCIGNSCNLRSTMTCGVGGDSCVACDPMRANQCSAAGQCRCGSGPLCAAGQTCNSGVCIGGACDGVSCPTGCCNGATCTLVSVASCGFGGSTCLPCNPTRSDNCTTDGSCQCGIKPSCATGQRCVAGACVCDSTSCPNGCCEGPVCTLQSLATCGSSGTPCQKCVVAAADSCTSGQCACGGAAACATGTRCVAGACVCDATSCATGCCSGNTCIAAPTPGMCGSGGSVCSMCDSTADTCGAGSCKCGTNPACAGGQQCVAGTCAAPSCTAATCPSGCCLNNVCMASSPTACGTSGAQCASCDPITSNTCTAGSCGCGGASACTGNQRCTAGACVACDSTSCPNGCCQGGVCTSPTLSSCGMNGVACVTCDIRSNSCVNGQCRCNGNSPCPLGQQCSATGTCTPIACNAASCPSGCCAGSCTTPSFASCGTNGSSCNACNSNRADNCSNEGVCRCGATPPCAANCVGMKCVGGMCNANNCPNGCCNSGNCVSPSTANCGFGGSACNSCNSNRADRCAPDGFCRCGTRLQCPNGQKCTAGTCS